MHEWDAIQLFTSFSEVVVPGENVQPLDLNAVEDEDTDVAMHITNGGDHGEEENDGQSEPMLFSEIFTRSIYSNGVINISRTFAGFNLKQSTALHAETLFSSIRIIV